MTSCTTKNLDLLTVGYSDSDIIYENCVIFPPGDKPLMGEFHLEPFDSLCGRFTAFEIDATDEISRRAKDTWEAIVDFVKSLDRSSLPDDSPYHIYIDHVERVASSIPKPINEYSNVNYQDLLNDFFIKIEIEQRQKKHEEKRS